MLNILLNLKHIALSSLLLCAVGGTLVYVINRKNNGHKRQYIPVAKILKLIIYPIKSLPGIEIDRAFITKHGLKFGSFKDRSFMLVTGEGRFITLRNESSLGLLKTSFHDDELWIDGPNMPTLKLKAKDKRRSNDVIIETNVWNQPIEGIDCGKEAEEWFSEYLQKPGIKLIQHVPQLLMRKSGHQVENEVKKSDEFPITFQDEAGVHIININSVNDLNERIPENSKVSYKNFRPSLLVTDCEPYEEDKWQFVNINNVHLKFLKPCHRCITTTINPNNKNGSTEPLETLRKYRLPSPELKKYYGNAPLFGTSLGPENQGEICCGDIISAVYRKDVQDLATIS